MSKYKEAMDAYIDEVMAHHNHQCDKCKGQFDDDEYFYQKASAYVKHSHWANGHSSCIKIKLSKKLGKKELIGEYGLLCGRCCYDWKFNRGTGSGSFEEWIKNG